MTSQTKGEEVCEMKDDKKIKTEKIVLNGLVIAGVVLTLLAVLSSPFIIVAIIKAGEFSALPPYTWILTTASVYVCAVPYLAALIELKLICSRISRIRRSHSARRRNSAISASAPLLNCSCSPSTRLCSARCSAYMSSWGSTICLFSCSRSSASSRESSRSRWAACSSARRSLKKKTTRYFDGGVTA